MTRSQLRGLIVICVVYAVYSLVACGDDDSPTGSDVRVDTVYIVAPDTGLSRGFNVWREKLLCDNQGIGAQLFCVEMGYEDATDYDCRSWNNVHYLYGITCWKR